MNTLLLITLLSIFGACVGSFLNVVIYRLPKMLEAQWKRDAHEYLDLPFKKGNSEFTLAFPGSHCPACKAPIRFQHNIPILGWLLLRGKCADCNAPIPARYPLIELAAACLFGLSAALYPLGIQLAGVLVMCALLVAMIGIDHDHRILPDVLTKPLLMIGILIPLVCGTFPQLEPIADGVLSLEASLWGAVLGATGLYLVYFAHKLVTGREGMGQGDIKLIAALGAWTGASGLPWLLIYAGAGGLVYAIFLRLILKDKQREIAFGPALAIAGLLQVFFPQ